MFKESYSARKLSFYNIKYDYYYNVSLLTFYWTFDGTLKINNNAVQIKGWETQIWRKINYECAWFRCITQGCMYRPVPGFLAKATHAVAKTKAGECGPNWARTSDPLIMSQVLLNCQPLGLIFKAPQIYFEIVQTILHMGIKKVHI